jgi:serine protease Do
MAWDNTRLLRAAGWGAWALGAIALAVIAAPVLFGQTVDTRQRSPLAQWMTLAGGGIGVEIRDLDDADVKREKLPAGTGAVIENVRASGAAAKAGMKAGDVIVSFDGERVRGAKHLERLIAETPAGRTVDAAVMRDGARVNMKVTIDEAQGFKALQGYRYSFNDAKPDFFEITMPKLRGNYELWLAPGRGKLGVGVQDLTEQLGDYFGTSTGALVTAVDANTPAKTAGLKAGDVITKINGEPVRDQNDLRRRLSAVSGEVTITVMRDRKELTLKTKIEDDQEVIKRKVTIKTL